MRRTRSGFWLFPIAVCGLAACGKEVDFRTERKVNVCSVEGKLLIDDMPAPFASLAFHPLAGSASTRCPVAITRPDGSFRLTTAAADDGAPPGEYVVTVYWPDPSNPVDECDCPDPAKHDLLRGVYADRATSGLRATVRTGENQVILRLNDAHVELR